MTTTTSTSASASVGRVGLFSGYLYKMVKKRDPTLGVSADAVEALEELCAFLVKELSDTCGEIACANHHQTLTNRDVIGALRLLMPGSLGSAAVISANTAAAAYAQSYVKE